MSQRPIGEEPLLDSLGQNPQKNTTPEHPDFQLKIYKIDADSTSAHPKADGVWTEAFDASENIDSPTEAQKYRSLPDNVKSHSPGGHGKVYQNRSCADCGEPLRRTHSFPELGHRFRRDRYPSSKRTRAIHVRRRTARSHTRSTYYGDVEASQSPVSQSLVSGLLDWVKGFFSRPASRSTHTSPVTVVLKPDADRLGKNQNDSRRSPSPMGRLKTSSSSSPLPEDLSPADVSIEDRSPSVRTTTSQVSRDSPTATQETKRYTIPTSETTYYTTQEDRMKSLTDSMNTDLMNQRLRSELVNTGLTFASADSGLTTMTTTGYQTPAVNPPDEDRPSIDGMPKFRMPSVMNIGSTETRDEASSKLTRGTDTLDSTGFITALGGLDEENDLTPIVEESVLTTHDRERHPTTEAEGYYSNGNLMSEGRIEQAGGNRDRELFKAFTDRESGFVEQGDTLQYLSDSSKPPQPPSPSHVSRELLDASESNSNLLAFQRKSISDELSKLTRDSSDDHDLIGEAKQRESANSIVNVAMADSSQNPDEPKHEEQVDVPRCKSPSLQVEQQVDIGNLSDTNVHIRTEIHLSSSSNLMRDTQYLVKHEDGTKSFENVKTESEQRLLTPETNVVAQETSTEPIPYELQTKRELVVLGRNSEAWTSDTNVRTGEEVIDNRIEMEERNRSISDEKQEPEETYNEPSEKLDVSSTEPTTGGAMPENMAIPGSEKQTIVMNTSIKITEDDQLNESEHVQKGISVEGIEMLDTNKLILNEKGRLQETGTPEAIQSPIQETYDPGPEGPSIEKVGRESKCPDEPVYSQIETSLGPYEGDPGTKLLWRKSLQSVQADLMNGVEQRKPDSPVIGQTNRYGLQPSPLTTPSENARELPDQQVDTENTTNTEHEAKQSPDEKVSGRIRPIEESLTVKEPLALSAEYENYPRSGPSEGEKDPIRTQAMRDNTVLTSLEVSIESVLRTTSPVNNRKSPTDVDVVLRTELRVGDRVPYEESKTDETIRNPYSGSSANEKVDLLTDRKQQAIKSTSPITPESELSLVDSRPDQSIQQSPELEGMLQMMDEELTDSVDAPPTSPSSVGAMMTQSPLLAEQKEYGSSTMQTSDGLLNQEAHTDQPAKVDFIIRTKGGSHISDGGVEAISIATPPDYRHRKKQSYEKEAPIERSISMIPQQGSTISGTSRSVLNDEDLERRSPWGPIQRNYVVEWAHEGATSPEEQTIDVSYRGKRDQSLETAGPSITNRETDQSADANSQDIMFSTTECADIAANGSDTKWLPAGTILNHVPRQIREQPMQIQLSENSDGGVMGHLDSTLISQTRKVTTAYFTAYSSLTGSNRHSMRSNESDTRIEPEANLIPDKPKHKHETNSHEASVLPSDLPVHPLKTQGETENDQMGAFDEETRIATIMQAQLEFNEQIFEVPEDVQSGDIYVRLEEDPEAAINPVLNETTHDSVDENSEDTQPGEHGNDNTEMINMNDSAGVYPTDVHTDQTDTAGELNDESEERFVSKLTMKLERSCREIVQSHDSEQGRQWSPELSVGATTPTETDHTQSEYADSGDRTRRYISVHHTEKLKIFPREGFDRVSSPFGRSSSPRELSYSTSINAHVSNRTTSSELFTSPASRKITQLSESYFHIGGNAKPSQVAIPSNHNDRCNSNLPIPEPNPEAKEVHVTLSQDIKSQGNLVHSERKSFVIESKGETSTMAGSISSQSHPNVAIDRDIVSDEKEMAKSLTNSAIQLAMDKLSLDTRDATRDDDVTELQHTEDGEFLHVGRISKVSRDGNIHVTCSVDMREQTRNAVTVKNDSLATGVLSKSLEVPDDGRTSRMDIPSSITFTSNVRVESPTREPNLSLVQETEVDAYEGGSSERQNVANVERQSCTTEGSRIGSDVRSRTSVTIGSRSQQIDKIEKSSLRPTDDTELEQDILHDVNYEDMGETKSISTNLCVHSRPNSPVTLGDGQSVTTIFHIHPTPNSTEIVSTGQAQDQRETGQIGIETIMSMSMSPTDNTDERSTSPGQTIIRVRQQIRVKRAGSFTDLQSADMLNKGTASPKRLMGKTQAGDLSKAPSPSFKGAEQSLERTGMIEISAADQERNKTVESPEISQFTLPTETGLHETSERQQTKEETTVWMEASELRQDLGEDQADSEYPMVPPESLGEPTVTGAMSALPEGEVEVESIVKVEGETQALPGSPIVMMEQRGEQAQDLTQEQMEQVVLSVGTDSHYDAQQNPTTEADLITEAVAEVEKEVKEMETAAAAEMEPDVGEQEAGTKVEQEMETTATAGMEPEIEEQEAVAKVEREIKEMETVAAAGLEPDVGEQEAVTKVEQEMETTAAAGMEPDVGEQEAVTKVEQEMETTAAAGIEPDVGEQEAVAKVEKEMEEIDTTAATGVEPTEQMMKEQEAVAEVEKEMEEIETTAATGMEPTEQMIEGEVGPSGMAEAVASTTDTKAVERSIKDQTEPIEGTEPPITNQLDNRQVSPVVTSQATKLNTDTATAEQNVKEVEQPQRTEAHTVEKMNEKPTSPGASSHALASSMDARAAERSMALVTQPVETDPTQKTEQASGISIAPHEEPPPQTSGPSSRAVEQKLTENDEIVKDTKIQDAEHVSGKSIITQAKPLPTASSMDTKAAEQKLEQQPGMIMAAREEVSKRTGGKPTSPPALSHGITFNEETKAPENVRNDNSPPLQRTTAQLPERAVRSTTEHANREEPPEVTDLADSNIQIGEQTKKQMPIERAEQLTTDKPQRAPDTTVQGRLEEPIQKMDTLATAPEQTQGLQEKITGKVQALSPEATESVYIDQGGIPSEVSLKPQKPTRSSQQEHNVAQEEIGSINIEEARLSGQMITPEVQAQKKLTEGEVGEQNKINLEERTDGIITPVGADGTSQVAASEMLPDTLHGADTIPYTETTHPSAKAPEPQMTEDQTALVTHSDRSPLQPLEEAKEPAPGTPPTKTTIASPPEVNDAKNVEVEQPVNQELTETGILEDTTAAAIDLEAITEDEAQEQLIERSFGETRPSTPMETHQQPGENKLAGEDMEEKSIGSLAAADLARQEQELRDFFQLPQTEDRAPQLTPSLSPVAVDVSGQMSLAGRGAEPTSGQMEITVSLKGEEGAIQSSRTEGKTSVIIEAEVKSRGTPVGIEIKIEPVESEAPEHTLGENEFSLQSPVQEELIPGIDAQQGYTEQTSVVSDLAAAGGQVGETERTPNDLVASFKQSEPENEQLSNMRPAENQTMGLTVDADQGTVAIEQYQSTPQASEEKMKDQSAGMIAGLRQVDFHDPTGTAKDQNVAEMEAVKVTGGALTTVSGLGPSVLADSGESVLKAVRPEFGQAQMSDETKLQAQRLLSELLQLQDEPNNPLAVQMAQRIIHSNDPVRGELINQAKSRQNLEEADADRYKLNQIVDLAQRVQAVIQEAKMEFLAQIREDLFSRQGSQTTEPSDLDVQSHPPTSPSEANRVIEKLLQTVAQSELEPTSEQWYKIAEDVASLDDVSRNQLSKRVDQLKHEPTYGPQQQQGLDDVENLIQREEEFIAIAKVEFLRDLEVKSQENARKEILKKFSVRLVEEEGSKQPIEQLSRTVPGMAMLSPEQRAELVEQAKKKLEENDNLSPEEITELKCIVKMVELAEQMIQDEAQQTLTDEDGRIPDSAADETVERIVKILGMTSEERQQLIEELNKRIDEAIHRSDDKGLENALELLKLVKRIEEMSPEERQAFLQNAQQRLKQLRETMTSPGVLSLSDNESKRTYDLMKFDNNREDQKRKCHSIPYNAAMLRGAGPNRQSLRRARGSLGATECWQCDRFRSARSGFIGFRPCGHWRQMEVERLINILDKLILETIGYVKTHPITKKE